MGEKPKPNLRLLQLRTLGRTASAGLVLNPWHAREPPGQTISLPFPKPRLARLSVKKKQESKLTPLQMKCSGCNWEKPPKSPSAFITNCPDRRVRLAGTRKALPKSPSSPLIDKQDGAGHLNDEYPMPQEQLVTAINNNKSEIIKDFDVDMILPEVRTFMSPSQLEAIVKCDTTEKKTLQFIETVAQSSHIRALMNSFVGFLAGIYPKHFKKVKGREPTHGECMSCLSNYLKDKKRLIIKRGNDLVCDSDKQMDLETDYVQLYLIKSDDAIKDDCSDNQSSIDEEEKTDSQTNFVSAHGIQIAAKDLIDRRFIQGRKVVLKGRGGIGKTTLLQWLSYEWAKERASMPFSILFLLQLRVLLTVEYPVSLLQLLNVYCQFATGRPVSKAILTKWMQNWGHMVLVMLDGVDEIKDLGYKLRYTRSIKDINEEALPMDIFINLLRGDLLPEAKLIITTRPTLGLQTPEGDISVEVMGLTKDGIAEYIEKNVPKEYAMEVASCLLNNSALMSLCSITYYCVVLSSLLTEDSSIAKRDITTYTRLTCCIIMKMAARSEDPENIGDASDFKPYLYKLAKLAFWAVFCREPADGCTTLFDVKDMVYAELTKEDLEQANHDGIIHISEAFNDKNCRTKKFLFQFTHLTLQELFASVFFLDGDSVTKSERKRVLEWVFRHGYFNMAILFIFGLRFDSKCEYIKRLRTCIQCKRYSTASIQRRFKSMFDTSMDAKLLEYLKNISKSAGRADKQDYKLQVSHLLYESNRPEMTEWLADSNPLIQKDGTLQIKDVALTAVDIMALVHVARHSRNLRFLHLVCVNLDYASFWKIAEFLAERNSLQILNLSYNSFSAESCHTLEFVLPYGTHLTTLQLDAVGFGDDGVLSVVNGLIASSPIRTLSLDSNNITDRGVGYLVKDTVPKLSTLSLSNNCISDVGIMNICFSDMLASLKCLILSFNQISITGANYLISKFSGDELNLRGNQINLAKLDHNTNSTVELIDLQENETGERRVKVLIDQINSGKQFYLIDLASMEINDYSLTLLVKALVGNQKVQRLNLAKNRLSRKSSKAIKALTFTCPGLEEVDISGNSPALDVCDAFEGPKLKREVKHLDLSRTMTTPGLNQLSCIVRNNAALECLTLSHNDIKVPDLTYLIRGLKHCRALTSLELSFTNIGSEHSDCLSKVIKQCSRLLSLDLSKNRIDFDTMVSISDALRGNPKLEYLNLNHNNIRDKGIEELFHAIQNNDHLTNLHVASNNIEAAGMLTIAEALVKDLSITELNLSHNNINDGALEAISKSLATASHLEILKLQDMSISSDGAEYLANSLETNRSLNCLDLFQNNIGDQGAQAIAKSLTQNDTLKKIILRANQIGPEGITAIAQALPQNSTLQHLDVGMNMIGTPGAKEIGLALRLNDTLRELDLFASELDHRAVWHITNALKSNRSLKSLAIGWNDVKSRGVFYVANALMENGDLQCLDLSENDIGSGGALFLSEILMCNTGLLRLNLDGNRLHTVGVDAIIRTVRARDIPLHASLQRNGVFVGSGDDILSKKKTLSSSSVVSRQGSRGGKTDGSPYCETYYNRAFSPAYYKRKSYENVEYYMLTPSSFEAPHEYLNTPLYANVGPGTLRPATELVMVSSRGHENDKGWESE